MGKQEELIKLDRAIKDAEVRIRTFATNVDTLQKEIDFLLNIERQLEENIAYLKNIKIVALAMEYKKAKEDLKKTKTRISQVSVDRTNNEKAVKEIEFLLQKNKEAYDQLTKNSENNVLQGKFGKPRD
jgi:chromosome segregation ATPase